MASVFALRVFSLFLFFSLLEETSLILLVLLVGDVPVEECLAYCSLYTCENLPPREDECDIHLQNGKGEKKQIANRPGMFCKRKKPRVYRSSYQCMAITHLLISPIRL